MGGVSNTDGGDQRFTKFWVGSPKGRDHSVRHACRWEDNIKVDVQQ
jgi:hypothetical protein